MVETFSIDGHKQKDFDGFERPDASFIMCPNEFLDLVVPNQSLGCIRLVAFVLYETLRWINEDGTPNTQEIEFSFNDLVNKAGISRGAASMAKQEAIDANFLDVVEAGVAKGKGVKGRKTTVRLKWGQNNGPVSSIDRFDGFFSGTGNFTALPHSYFTKILPSEAPATIKFVSVIFRYTEGYRMQFGRRKSIPLSFQNLHRLMKVKSPNILAKTIKHSVSSNFVELVHAGNWSPGGLDSKAAVYAPKYASTKHVSTIGSKTIAKVEFKNDSRKSSKYLAVNEFKNDSAIKKTKINTQTSVVDSEILKILITAGFKNSSAQKIATKATKEVVENQIIWMPHRKNVENFHGYLKKAIEENFDQPEVLRVRKTPSSTLRKTLESKF